MNEPERYRYDGSTSKLYEFSSQDNAYIFCFSVPARTSKKAAIREYHDHLDSQYLRNPEGELSTNIF